ncbi:PaaI family thioesterase [Gordonia crocea]|nr:PaaI family thioesterase [Gordonia crocea]
MTPEQFDAEAALFGPLTDSVRTLMEATLMSEAEADDVARARALVDEAAALLNTRRGGIALGTRWGTDGIRRSWGNAVMGLRNPVAPPLEFTHDDDGPSWAEAELGGLYEGPPGLVHGGVVALLLDQALGSAAFYAGSPGMTGTLTVRYRQGTKLGPVRVEAALDRVEGVKSFVVGTVITPDGVCAEAEGIFILPREVRHLAGELAQSFHPGEG